MEHPAIHDAIDAIFENLPPDQLEGVRMALRALIGMCEAFGDDAVPIGRLRQFLADVTPQEDSS